MKEKVYKFETLQLHADRMSQTAQPMQEQYRSMRQHPMYSRIPSRQQRFALREGAISGRLMNPTSDV